jgi:hypothetical protein
VSAINKGRENYKKEKPLQNTIIDENGPMPKRGLARDYFDVSPTKEWMKNESPKWEW